MSRVFARNGLRLDVKISYTQVGLERSFPYIQVRSWIQGLERAGQLHKLVGLGSEHQSIASPAVGKALEEFWARFQMVHGTHEVFQLARDKKLSLATAFPLFLHGDEGTTYKKEGCLCISMHSPLGRGTLSNKLGPVTADAVLRDPHVNFVGHAFETRFLLGALLRVD